MSSSLIKFKLLSISQAASFLGIGKDNLNELMEEGKIGFISVGKRNKIPVSELERFIDENLTYVNSDGKLKLNNNMPSEILEEFDSTKLFDKIKKGVK
jgi:excisionase family DNA binding protein